MRCKCIEKKDGYFLITVRHWWREISFFGDCTVWHDTKTGSRPSVFVESLLSDFVAWYKHKEKKS